MKANTLIKKTILIKDIYENIQRSNDEYNQNMVYYPSMIYISDEIKLELMSNGFKVYTGDVDVVRGCLIIEW